MSNHALRHWERRAAQFRRATESLIAAVQNDASKEQVKCDICGAMVGVKSIGLHRDRHGYPRRQTDDEADDEYHRYTGEYPSQRYRGQE